MKQAELKAFQSLPILVHLEPIGEAPPFPPEKVFIAPSIENELILSCSDHLWMADDLPVITVAEKVLYFVHNTIKNGNVELIPLKLKRHILPPGAESIAVDEKIIEEIKEKTGDMNKNEETACRWLTDEFILEPISNYKQTLIIAEYSEFERSQPSNGFSILGRKYTGHIKISDNTIIFDSITKTRNPPPFISLLEWDVRFSPDTLKAKIQSPAFQQQFKKEKNDPQAFLNLWEKYLDISIKLSEDKKNEAGKISYTYTEPEKEGSTKRIFHIGSKPEDIEKFVTALGYIEAENRIIKVESPSETNNSTLMSFYGYDIAKKQIILDTALGYLINFPEKGFLSLSLIGEEVANKRREKAFERITSQSLPIPSIYYHLYEEQLPTCRRCKSRKLTTTELFKSFNNKHPNKKQKQAVETILKTPDIALIQGPPGTGKTQVIAAIQNLLEKPQKKQDRPTTILLTSYQHDAVDNIAERVEVFGLPAYRYGGKTHHHIELKNWQKEQKIYLEKMINAVDSNSELKSLNRISHLLIELRSANIPPSIIYRRLKLLEELFIKEDTTLNIPVEYQIELNKLIQQYHNVNALQPNHLINKLKKIIWGLRETEVGFRDDGQIQIEHFLGIAQLKLYNTRTRKLLQPLIEFVEQSPKINNEYFNTLLELKNSLLLELQTDNLWKITGSRNSQLNEFRKQCSQYITKRISKTPASIVGILDEFRENILVDEILQSAINFYMTAYATTCQKSVSTGFRQICQDADFIFNTPDSDNFGVFDYVVIDEAARANPLDLFIPMVLAKQKIILVGDHKQLPHLLEPEIENKLSKEHEPLTIKEKLQDSLFERLWRYLKKKPDGVTRTISLDQQYRMHPKLGDFISKTFYEADGEKIYSPLSASKFVHDIQQYKGEYAVWEDCTGHGEEKNISANGYYRTIEAEKIADIAKNILEESEESLGIITAYKLQKEEIKKVLQRKMGGGYDTRLRIGTIDSFQGREFDIVIFSPVRSNKIKLPERTDEYNKENNRLKAARRKFGFLTFQNRLNVAMSRQRKLLIVVGDSTMFATEDANKYVHGLYMFQALCKGEMNV